MSICKRRDGRWQISYRDGDNVRTKTFPSNKKGKKAALAFEGEIQKLKAMDLPLPQAHHEDVYLDQIMQAWLNEKKAQGRALKWLQDWAAIFNKVFSPRLCQRPAHQITSADIMSIISEHYSHVKQPTRNRYVGYLKSAFNYGVSHGLITQNPLSTWQKGKEHRHKSPLTLEDLQKIKAAAPEHLAWALDVAWNIPARPGPSDLFALRYAEHVDFERGGVAVYHTKVGREAFVQCSPAFLEKLQVRRAENKSGFIIEYRGKPVKDLGRALATAARKSGLIYTPCMYDIRHLWITTMLDQGIEVSAVAYAAGTSVRMIMSNYYEPHQAERRKLAEKLPSLDPKNP